MNQTARTIAVGAPIGARRVQTGIDVRSAFYIAAFGTLALCFLAWPVWRAQFPLEIWLTEGWNAYLQDAAGSFKQLYPSAHDLTGNNYPPLSFYTIGLLGKLLGDNLYIGRVLSIIGLLGVSLEIFLSARILSRAVLGPAIGALWYVAIMAHNSAAYVGTNDPQLFGEAIMGAALVWFLARDDQHRSKVAPLLLMVVAGFWKHNMIAIPLTAVVWLLLRDRSRAIRPVLVSIAAIIAGLSLCGLLFGANFFDDLFAPRSYGWGNIFANAGHLQWSALAFTIWLAWAISERHSKPALFTSLHVAAGLFACLLQWFGEGVSGNAEFDLLLALGIAVGVTFAQMERSWFARYIRPDYLRDAMVITLALRLVATDRHEPALLLLSPDFRLYFEAGSREANTETTAVASFPGRVYCSNKIVCRMAGKAFVVDDFKVEEMISTGGNTRDQISELLKLSSIVFFRNSDITRASPNTSLSGMLQR
jgi:hypothetical protein